MIPLPNFRHPDFSMVIHQATKEQKRYNILVIDDNSALRRVLRDALRNSYNIIEANDIEVGLTHAMQNLPDLIITGVGAADQEGESICFILKQSHKTSHIPVVVLTSKDDTYSRIKSFYLGADDFIRAPFHLLELQIRIKNLIQSRKILQEKFTRHVELKPMPVESPSEDELFLQRVVKIMEENMADPGFGSEAFAKELGLSQTRLYRKLTGLTGYSSNDFIRRMRLQRAADLLTKQVGNVSEVAYRVGFNSMSYFAKCFKQQHQYSPRDFVKRGCS